MSEEKTHWKKQFNYDYLGSYSLPEGKDVVLTIAEMKREKVVGANGKKEECFVCYFVEKADWIKPMILNRTNCKVIEKLYRTPFIEDWKGHRIQIGSSRVDAFGEKTDALRVRTIIPKDVNEKPTVQTGSAVWNNILSAIKGGYKINQITDKYSLSQEQIKALQSC